ncbi:hypothetical protein NDU88_003857 [Pleurodeles waltl]|uniref:Uncharacterized protein n=1 Tax=Pleurodeles waltl TaxID=8319 RepID=A0AAV7LI49_PLEWA|nr:hypothetical protein NDU88_003857 [Pleurodeles waltl]
MDCGPQRRWCVGAYSDIGQRGREKPHAAGVWPRPSVQRVWSLVMVLHGGALGAGSAVGGCYAAPRCDERGAREVHYDGGIKVVAGTVRPAVRH